MLPTPAEFREIVSGRRRGIAATGWRLAFSLVEPFYSAAVAWRNRRYDRGKKPVLNVGVPVVSVGNMTLGGTGKTPMVEWICRWFRGQGVRVAIVSRGYGAESGSRNDEAMELEQRLPDVPHVQDPDRVAAAQLAIEELGSQLIVLDDAFQHRRIARDLDLVMLDALEPFGHGRVFPRGTLREPLAGLRRAELVVLSRADLVPLDRRQAIRNEVRRLAPEAAWAEVVHAPQAIIAFDGRRQPLEAVKGKTVAAFCGIGNPAGFRSTLANCGVTIADFREHPDHHRYTRSEVESLDAWAQTLRVDLVLTTHKDLVKLGTDQLGRRPLRAVSIGLEFLAGQSELESRLARLHAAIPDEAE